VKLRESILQLKLQQQYVIFYQQDHSSPSLDAFPSYRKPHYGLHPVSLSAHLSVPCQPYSGKNSSGKSKLPKLTGRSPVSRVTDEHTRSKGQKSRSQGQFISAPLCVPLRLVTQERNDNKNTSNLVISTRSLSLIKSRDTMYFNWWIHARIFKHVDNVAPTK